MIINQTTDIAGFIRIQWQQPSGVVYHFKFREMPSLQDLTNLANQQDELNEYSNEQSIEVFDFFEKSLLIDFVTTIKERPSITLTQFNNAIANRTWHEQAQLRTLIYLIGSEIAKRGELNISNLTEAQFLNLVRNWISNTPVKRLKRLFSTIDF